MLTFNLFFFFSCYWNILLGSYNNQVCKFILFWTWRPTKLVLTGLLILLDMTAPKMFQPAYIHPCKWEYLATYCKNPSKTFPNAVCKSHFLRKLKGFSKKKNKQTCWCFYDTLWYNDNNTGIITGSSRQGCSLIHDGIEENLEAVFCFSFHFVGLRYNNNYYFYTITIKESLKLFSLNFTASSAGLVISTSCGGGWNSG